MKKSDAFSDVKSDTDTKRLFKTINDISHYLDQQKTQIRFSSNLFSSNVESQRSRLCCYIEKLMFSAPVEYGRKCEEILWRKGFYDVYTTLKRLKKQDAWTSDEICLLTNMFYSGIGFYQYLITRLQDEFLLELDGVAEFPMFRSNFGLVSRASGNQSSSIEVKKWAENCVHRNLVYIGDLNRYMFDFYPGWDISIAFRYYMKALYFKPSIGMPHNQLGTLSNVQNFTLDAVYRYLRCLYCTELFDGAEGNLVTIMEQYPPLGLAYSNLPLKKRIFSQFLHFVGVWFLQKSPIKDVDLLCSEFVENINVWFPEVVSTTILKHEPTTLQSLVETKNVKSFDLPESENAVFKVLIVFIMCHHKLYQKQNKTDSATAVIIAIISKTIEYVVNKLKETLPTPSPPTLPEKDNVNRKSSRRRRRRRFIKAKSLSDDELSQHSNDAPQNGKDSNEEDSEENLIFDEYSEEESSTIRRITNGNSVSHNKSNGTINGKSTETTHKTASIKNLTKFFQEQYYMMQAIKISCDWLRCNQDVFSTILSWKIVFDNLSLLLNYATPLINHKNKDQATTNENIPLPEDVELKEFQALKPVQDKLCWKWNKITSLTLEEEMKQRIQNLLEFGKFLATLPDTTLLYDKDKHWFFTSVKDEVIVEKKNKKLDDELRGKLMKEMGQLWLEAEVKNLESKVKQTAKVNLMTPYLVVDSEALTQHCILVKKLVSSRQFVLLIPASVVSTLDELKRTSGRARDAIRWLESQFRQGNRFLRMQRNNEKQSIPLVSYPRKKDNEAWLFMQIVEFCYHLNQTNATKNKSAKTDKKEEDSNFVRLLTGSRELANLKDNDVTMQKEKAKHTPFSMTVVKKSAGLLIEHIVDFYGKWKDSTKSHG